MICGCGKTEEDDSSYEKYILGHEAEFLTMVDGKYAYNALLEVTGMNEEKNVDIGNFAENIMTAIEQHRTLEERAQKYDGRIGPYEKFDWGEPVGRERE